MQLLLEAARLAITIRALNTKLQYDVIISYISCSFLPPCTHHCKFCQRIHPDRN